MLKMKTFKKANKCDEVMKYMSNIVCTTRENPNLIMLKNKLQNKPAIGIIALAGIGLALLGIVGLIKK